MKNNRVTSPYLEAKKEIIADLQREIGKQYGLHKVDYWLIEWMKKYMDEDYENL